MIKRALITLALLAGLIGVPAAPAAAATCLSVGVTSHSTEVLRFTDSEIQIKQYFWTATGTCPIAMSNIHLATAPEYSTEFMWIELLRSDGSVIGDTSSAAVAVNATYPGHTGNTGKYTILANPRVYNILDSAHRYAVVMSFSPGGMPVSQFVTGTLYTG